MLPLTAPLLIFGTRATDLSMNGEPTAGPLYLLGSACRVRGLARTLAIAAA